MKRENVQVTNKNFKSLEYTGGMLYNSWPECNEQRRKTFYFVENKAKRLVIV